MLAVYYSLQCLPWHHSTQKETWEIQSLMCEISISYHINEAVEEATTPVRLLPKALSVKEEFHSSRSHLFSLPIMCLSDSEQLGPFLHPSTSWLARLSYTKPHTQMTKSVHSVTSLWTRVQFSSLNFSRFGLSNSLRARIRVSVEHCVYKDQEKGGWSGAKLGQSARNITSTPSLTHVNHTFESQSPWSWMLGITQAMAQRRISLWTLRNGLLNLHCARGKTQRDVINPI